ncbi:hypothetical protein MKW98_028473 [Papaver atlanticum]|uniref:Uncharacterized protein n=1 Tax=Papaver atlanticum TaxID=357466 RepID=A0AAD4XX64_9MAGN|nr:hypothetical protein MKW98_028473 [Papaver atlanticum]
MIRRFGLSQTETLNKKSVKIRNKKTTRNGMIGYKRGCKQSVELYKNDWLFVFVELTRGCNTTDVSLLLESISKFGVVHQDFQQRMQEES